MLIVNFLLLISFGAVFGFPSFDELMHEQGDDTAVVESVVREARAVGPTHIADLLGPGVKDAFLHTYGDKNDEDGELQGYTKKMQDKGNDGYKHFDSYHKKDSDKYGYEVHSEFGQGNKAGVDTTDKNGKYSDEEKENTEEDDGEETKNLYRIASEDNQNKKSKKAVEDYDYGYEGDSGDSAKYSDGEAESEGEGGSSYEGGEGKSASYSSGGGDSGSYSSGGDYSESEGYSEGDEY